MKRAAATRLSVAWTVVVAITLVYLAIDRSADRRGRARTVQPTGREPFQRGAEVRWARDDHHLAIETLGLQPP